MKKRFKLLIGIILIICFLVFVATYYFLYYDRKLSGDFVTDGVYLYNIDVGDYNHNITVKNDTIYYYINSEDKYEFYKIDIYSNKTKKIGEVNLKNSYCYFENDFINCADDNNKIIYSFDFKKIYDGEQKLIIPYKKDYIKYENNTIYYKDKEYKKISKDLTSYNAYDYYTFDDNAFIFFAGEEDDCLLNVEDNKCENYKYTGIRRYNNGLYYFNEEKINVLNIKTKEIKEYTNYVKDSLLTRSQLDNNLLYYFSSDYLRIYNLESGKVNLFDYRINEYVDSVFLNNNLLYLVISDKVYVLKLDEIITEEMLVDELNDKLEEKQSSRIKNIYDKYSVDIKIKKDADLKLDVWQQKIIGEYNYDYINDALDYIDEVMELFGEDFFKELIHDEYTGLRIYLASDIESDFSMDGEAFRYYDKYAIIMRSSGGKRTLCHELMHSLEDAVFAKNKKMFSKWNKYNPKGFKYKESYNENAGSYEYTPTYGKGDVYFVDNYSQTDELEDRARIFENICMNTTDTIKNNSYLLKKAEYLESEVLLYYPMLKNTTIFDSLK